MVDLKFWKIGQLPGSIPEKWYNPKKFIKKRHPLHMSSMGQNESKCPKMYHLWCASGYPKLTCPAVFAKKQPLNRKTSKFGSDMIYVLFVSRLHGNFGENQ